MRTISTILAFFAAFTCFSQTLVAPWAEGHGRFTTGGRGHGVFFVTNTNNSGSGSYRQALADAISAGGGNIIFRTGGTVNSNDSNLNITGSNITIWGQSAPGGGFAVYNAETYISGQNIAIFDMRFRGGDNLGGRDTFRIGSGSLSTTLENFFFDHCTFSWAKDENFSIATGTNTSGIVRNVTMQNSIVSESFGSKNILLWGRNIYNISFLNNYLANTQQRNIRASVAEGVAWEQINNFVYGYYIGVNPTNKNVVDVINNVFEEGFATASTNTIGFNDCSSDNCPPSGDTSFTGTALYHTGNTKDGGSITVSSNVSSYITGSRNVSSGYAYRPTNEVKAYVLANAGARAWVDNVDALDAHVLADGANGSTGSWPSNESQTTGLPSLSAGTPYTDSDNDGMADSWEIANFGDLSKTYNGTDLGGGYTNLEYFMFSLSGWYPADPEIPVRNNEQKKSAATNILNW